MSSETQVDKLIGYARVQSEAARLDSTPLPLDIPFDAFKGYTIVRCIGRGGQGVVLESIEETTGRRVAIKVLREGPFQGRTERMRFDREVKILAGLNHPNIVTIHSSGIVQGHPFFVMDFVAGRTLAEFLEQESPGIDSLLAIFLRICDAVHASHLQGIVHRDLKPTNIRIDPYGEPRVLDFGLAKRLVDMADGGPMHSVATLTGQVVGSLPWAAPEQLKGGRDSTDLRTDVYGLGLILYTMLTGQPPFRRSDNVHDMMEDILSGNLTPLRTSAPGIDDDLITIVETCLHADLGRRYQIAGELARDIERYRAGLPILAKRDSSSYVILKTIRRHRIVTGLSLLIVLLAVGYGITVSILYQNAASAELLAEKRAEDARAKYVLARDALEFVVREVSENLEETPRSIAVRRAILEGAFDRLATLAGQHGDDPLLRKDLLRTHYQLGRIAIDLGRFDLARPHLQRALEERLALCDEGTPTSKELAELSINYVLLGDVAHHSGDPDEKIRCFLKALEIDERLVEDYPDNLNYLDNLAWSYDRLGDYEKRLGNYDKIQEYHEKQLDIMTRLVEAEPTNPIRLHGLAMAHGRMIPLANRRQDKTAALHHAELAIDASRKAHASGKDSSVHICQYMNLLDIYSCCRYSVDVNADDTDLFEEMHELATELVEREPDSPMHQFALARSLLKLSGLPSVRQKPGERERLVLEAVRIYQEYEKDLPPSEDLYTTGFYLKKAYHSVLQKEGRIDECKALKAEILTLLENSIEAGYRTPVFLTYRAVYLAEAEGADPDLVVPFIDEASEALDRHRERRSSRYFMLGNAYGLVGKYESQIEMYLKAEQKAQVEGVPLDERAVSALKAYRENAKE